MRTCDCGAPAVSKKNGDFCCQHCIDMENQSAARQKKSGVRDDSESTSRLNPDDYWSQGLNWGSSLVKLEQLSVNKLS